MTDEQQLNGAWLVAAWPGMGNVAVIAAGALIAQFGLRQTDELEPADHFDINEIDVVDGVIDDTRLPRGLFFRGSPRPGGRELIVFLGEAQPTWATWAYANKLLDAARAMGVTRVLTFAAIASALFPEGDPKVVGIATDDRARDELSKAEVELMQAGQIGGLNGVILGAAAKRGISGMGLLAEIPFFAANIPNPKGARAALSVLGVLGGLDLNLDELDRHAAKVDKLLIRLFEKLQAVHGEGDETLEIDEEQVSNERADEPETPPLDRETHQRIERLFEMVAKDRAKAMILKEELDRLGVFERYEDRFLDLFRRAE